MSDTRAVCPHCQKEVVFVKGASSIRCPECGAKYRSEDPSGLHGFVGRFVKAILIMVLIFVALIIVGVSVAFAGCVLMSGH